MEYTNYTADDFACDESFVRYFFKENEHDIFFWEQWIEDHPEKRKEIEGARQLVNTLSLGLSQVEVDEEVRKISEHIYGNPQWKGRSMRISPDKDSYDQFRKKNKYSISWKLAAVLLMIVAVSAVLFLTINKSTKKVETLAVNTEQVVKRNSKGQKSSLHLSDGSVITLNSDSEVRFFENFSKNLREVELRGEAFFEIARDPSRPFIVKTEEINIKALGTSFNVLAYNETKEVKVALVTGKVEVDLKEVQEGKSILIPGEGLTFDRVRKHVTKERFDPELTLAWRKGILYFKNASWDYIITTLERWYNVQFEVENRPLTRSSYTGQFDNQSLELILESLSFSKNFEYEIDGAKIKVKFSSQP